MNGRGDYLLGSSIVIYFTTRSVNGAFALASGAAVCYDETNTPISTGVTLTASVNSVVGLNRVVIDTTTGYSKNKDYHVVMSAGTVDGVSVVGEIVGNFSIEKQMSTKVYDLVDTEVAAIKAKTDLISAAPATQTSLDAVATSVSTILTAVDTEVAAIKAKTDLITAAPATQATLVSVQNDVQAMVNDIATISSDINDVGTVTSAVNVTTTRLNGMLEVIPGSSPTAYRYHTAALTQAPTDGGGSWTDDEKSQIRSALGVDGTKVTAVNGQLQSITANIVDPLSTQVASFRTSIESMVLASIGFNDDRFNEVVAQVGQDWTETERRQIREALGVSGVHIQAAGGQLQAIPEITEQLLAAVTGTIDQLISTATEPIGANAAKIVTAFELDGAVWRLTANALELAPAGGGGGGGGGGDWTAQEKEQIRHALGVTGSVTTQAVGGQLQQVVNQSQAMANLTALWPADIVNAIWTSYDFDQPIPPNSPAAYLQHIAKWEIVGGMLRVLNPDGTLLWQAAITRDTAGNITGIAKQ